VTGEARRFDRKRDAGTDARAGVQHRGEDVMDTVKVLWITGAVGHPMIGRPWDTENTLEVVVAECGEAAGAGQLQQSLPQEPAEYLVSILEDQSICGSATHLRWVPAWEERDGTNPGRD